jgi:myosin I
MKSDFKTNRSAYFIISTVVDGQFNMTAERVISLGAIKYVALSSLRDDWVAFVLGLRDEPDVFFSCVFKTELVTRLQILLRGIDLRIGPTYVFPANTLT